MGMTVDDVAAHVEETWVDIEDNKAQQNDLKKHKRMSSDIWSKPMNGSLPHYRKHWNLRKSPQPQPSCHRGSYYKNSCLYINIAIFFVGWILFCFLCVFLLYIHSLLYDDQSVRIYSTFSFSTYFILK